MDIHFIDAYVRHFHCMDARKLSHWWKTNTITVYCLHYCHRTLRWRRWCNKSEWRWDSFAGPRSSVTAAPPRAPCGRRRQRSFRRRKRRRRPHGPTRWTTRAKQKETEAASSNGAASFRCWRDVTLSRLPPRLQRTAAKCRGIKKKPYSWGSEKDSCSEWLVPSGGAEPSRLICEDVFLT